MSGVMQKCQSEDQPKLYKSRQQKQQLYKSEDEIDKWKLSISSTIKEEFQRHIDSFKNQTEWKNGEYKFSEKNRQIIQSDQEHCKIIIKIQTNQQATGNETESVSSVGFKILELTLIKCMYNGKRSVMFILQNSTAYHKIKNLLAINENKSQMLNHVSHEIRTPLNCIIGMLEQAELDREIFFNNLLKPALSSAKMLVCLVNDLLDESQQQAGTFQLSINQFNLKQLILSVKETMQILCEAKKLDLIVNYPEGMTEIINSDQFRIRQILLNLIGNSVKFTKQGNITIDIAILNSEYIRIGVKDTGVGISKENQQKLFKAFGKIKNKQTGELNPQGVGLGLMISNKLAKQLSYNASGIVVESKEKIGTTFSFLVKNIQQTISQESDSIQQTLEEIKTGQNENYQEQYQSPKSPDKTSVQFRGQSSYFQNHLIEMTTHQHEDGPTSNLSVPSKLINNLSISKQQIENESPNVVQSPVKKFKTKDTQFIGCRKKGDSLAYRLQLETISSNGYQSDNPNEKSQKETIINQQQTQNEEIQSQQSCKCNNILIVDDQPFNILTLASILQKQGYISDTASNGEEAFQKVQDRFFSSCCNFYKIIFMDIHMPFLNGLESTKDQQEQNDKQEKEELLQIGMANVLQKPVDIKSITLLVEQLIKQQ